MSSRQPTDRSSCRGRSVSGDRQSRPTVGSLRSKLEATLNACLNAVASHHSQCSIVFRRITPRPRLSRRLRRPRLCRRLRERPMFHRWHVHHFSCSFRGEVLSVHWRQSTAERKPKSCPRASLRYRLFFHCGFFPLWELTIVISLSSSTESVSSTRSFCFRWLPLVTLVCSLAQLSLVHVGLGYSSY